MKPDNSANVPSVGSHDVLGGNWHCMTDAPKDGREVELLVYHPNWRHCETDEERARWCGVMRGRWTDHNGGGWVWNGLYGSAWAWRPLPPNAAVHGRGPLK